jgi:hypothetical protein
MGLQLHGFPDAEPWTMEKLADWIRSIDPTVDQDEELICEQEVTQNVEVKA